MKKETEMSNISKLREEVEGYSCEGSIMVELTCEALRKDIDDIEKKLEVSGVSPNAVKIMMKNKIKQLLEENK